MSESAFLLPCQYKPCLQAIIGRCLFEALIVRHGDRASTLILLEEAVSETLRFVDSFFRVEHGKTRLLVMLFQNSIISF